MLKFQCHSITTTDTRATEKLSRPRRKIAKLGPLRAKQAGSFCYHLLYISLKWAYNVFQNISCSQNIEKSPAVVMDRLLPKTFRSRTNLDSNYPSIVVDRLFVYQKNFGPTQKIMGGVSRPHPLMCVLINNRFPIKRLPIKAALKLFDSIITPILLYGSEIWGTYNYLSFEKWDKCEIEKVHLNFCKHILGVNRSTTNILVRGELGRYPLKLNVENRIKSFFDHVKKAPEDSLIYQAYLMNLELPSDLNCNTHIENVKRNLDLVDFHSCAKHIFKLSYKNYYNKYWTREMSSSKKGEFLFL